MEPDWNGNRRDGAALAVFDLLPDPCGDIRRQEAKGSAVKEPVSGGAQFAVYGSNGAAKQHPDCVYISRDVFYWGRNADISFGGLWDYGVF